MYNNLREFVNILEREGELVRISESVSCNLEIAEITDRECKSDGGGRALLFENNDSGFPVVTNMMGSYRRMALALGVESLEEPADRIYDLFRGVTSEKRNFMDRVKMLPLLAEAAKWLPRKRGGCGECQSVILEVDKVDLELLPILKCAPCDGGRFITLPLVNTKSPESGAPNLGMYRMQVFSKDSTGMHWHLHKTGNRHYEEYKKRGEKMPVTVCLGGDPAYTYSATAPLPEGIDEYLLAGFLRGKPVELVKCVTNDLYVPSDCDFVIEGYVDPQEEKVLEGDFGDHTGFYSLEDYYPIFHVTAITHRKDAIYPATLVGVPPMEDAYIAIATERLFLAPIRLVVQPDLKDLWMPSEGVAHNIAIMDCENSYPGQPMKVISAMWGAGQMMFNKFAIVTSGLEGKLNDLEQLKECIKEVRIPEDVTISMGVLDVLDHTSNVCGYGGKMAIDATIKGSGQPNYSVESINSGGYNISDALYCDGWATLMMKLDHDVDFKLAAAELLDLNRYKGIKFLFIYDQEVDFGDVSMLIWLIGSNVDPARDVVINGEVLIGDCRSKYGGLNGFSRNWPNMVVMDKDTVDLVDRKWEDYKIGEFKESPSKKYSGLLKGDKAYV